MSYVDTFVCINVRYEDIFLSYDTLFYWNWKFPLDCGTACRCYA